MARGRTSSLTIRLTPAQRQTLMAWQRSTPISAGRARRGRLILLLADGVAISGIAATVGISRRFVYKWAQRFLEHGVEGLADKLEFDGGCIGLTAVNRDRFGEPVATDRLLQKLQCGLCVAVLGEQKVDRLARFIDGAVERAPLALDLDVRLVHPPADPYRALTPVKRLFSIPLIRPL